MSDLPEASTTYAENQRYARGGTLTGLVSARGQLGQMLRDITREESGGIGNAVRELSEELSKYSLFVQMHGVHNWSDLSTEIINKYQSMPSLRYMHRPTLAATFVFLYITGAMGNNIAVNKNNFDQPFDLVYIELINHISTTIPPSKIIPGIPTLRGYNSTINVNLSNLTKLQFKQTFLRYINAINRYNNS